MSKAIRQLGHKLEAVRMPGLLLTPKLVDFFAANPEPTFPKDLVDRAMEVLYVPRPKRDSRFSPSALGTCQRRQMLTYLNHPEKSPGGHLAKAFMDGHFAHAKWDLILLHVGLVEEIEFQVNLGPDLSGAMDALGQDAKGWFGVDIKTTDTPISIMEAAYAATLKYWDEVFTQGMSKVPLPESWAGKMLLKYWRQCHGYMLMAQSMGYNVQRYCLLMDLKGNERWKELPINFDPRIGQLVRNEWDALIQAKEDQVLPDILPDCAIQTDAECPQRFNCWSATWGRPQPIQRSVQIRIPVPQP